MNTKTLLAASLAVNALLLGTAAYWLNQDPGDLSTLAPVIICTNHTRAGAVETPAASAVSAVNPAQPIDRRRVESEDYTQHIASLRAEGQVHPTNRWQP